MAIEHEVLVPLVRRLARHDYIWPRIAEVLRTVVVDRPHSGHAEGCEGFTRCVLDLVSPERIVVLSDSTDFRYGSWVIGNQMLKAVDLVSCSTASSGEPCLELVAKSVLQVIQLGVHEVDDLPLAAVLLIVDEEPHDRTYQVPPGPLGGRDEFEVVQRNRAALFQPEDLVAFGVHNRLGDVSSTNGGLDSALVPHPHPEGLRVEDVISHRRQAMPPRCGV